LSAPFSLYDIQLTTIDGQAASMGAYRGLVILVVNVASRCGYTPQYAGLEALYRRHRDQGFVVLGFPCDQFGHQEPGTEAEIRRFCTDLYDVTFPMFAKIDVNGSATHELYRYLKASKKGLFGRSAILWNFSKFLLGSDGAVIRRYGSRDTPERIDPDVQRALAARDIGSVRL
jgi:glutathione peroxidase